MVAMERKERRLYLSIAVSLAALNLVIAALVAYAKVPIFLDSTGIVIATILLGWPYGLACAAFTVLGGFFIVNPYLPFYLFTSFAIVASVEFLQRQLMFSSLVRSVASGILIGLVSAVVSAPVTAYLFGGVTLSGIDVFTTYLISMGNTVLNSALFSGASSELVDKVLVCLAAYSALRTLPRSLYKEYAFRSPSHE